MKKEMKIKDAAILYNRLIGDTVNGSVITSPIVKAEAAKVETMNTVYIIESWRPDFNYEDAVKEIQNDQV